MTRQDVRQIRSTDDTSGATTRNQNALQQHASSNRRSSTPISPATEDGRIPYLSPRSSRTRKFRHYIETRWYPQWKFYDERAAHNKVRYLFFQRMIALGSVTVPIIIGIEFIPQWLPAIISGLVAAAAATENVMKYGDNWRTYRAAAEGLNREKVLYEARSGPYAGTNAPFRTFVERCEDVIAEETGRFFERQQDGNQAGGNGDETESRVSGVE